MLVDEEKVRKYCKENNLRYFKISCKNSIGTDIFMDDLINELIKK